MLQSHTSLEKERGQCLWTAKISGKANSKIYFSVEHVSMLALWVILWICKVIESAFMGDPPPSMHVIAFSDLDHFLGRLLCSSGDVTHHCTTLMAEFHSKCDYQPLCVELEHCVGWNYPLSLLASEKDKKRLPCFFHLFCMSTTRACYMCGGPLSMAHCAAQW